MGTSFRDHDEVDALGLAGYLTLARDGDEFSGALFVVNARGEPVHLLCNTVRVIDHFMWREEDLALAAKRRLIQSLIPACPAMPSLILCQASDTPVELFRGELCGAPLVGRIATGKRLEVTWYPSAPVSGTPAFTLWGLLSSHSLLHEPFARAARGMAEVASGDATAPNAAPGGT